MASLIYKWLALPLVFLSTINMHGSLPSHYILKRLPALHPYYISVVEINYNASDKTLEISCKIFTDDFEKVLAGKYNTKVDLIKPADRPGMEKLVADYVKKHLLLSVDGKAVSFNYVGYEQEQEAVYSYYQVDHVNTPKKINVNVSLLHDLNENQINIVHVTVSGTRKSTKLDYPKTEAGFAF